MTPMTLHARPTTLHRWIVIILVLALLHQVALPWSVRAETEESLGRKFSLVAQAQLPMVQDYTVRRYIQRIGERIVARLEHPDFPYQFTVVHEPHINAFSVPGGYIYIHSGLIQRANSDDEVASVLGHEIAHSQGHHMIRQQEDTKLLSYAGIASMVLALINPVLAAGASSMMGVAQMKYMRQLEEEADFRGLQNMKQAGFDPHAMTRFFETMQAEERFDSTDVPPYFRSHPMSKERMSAIERILKTMQWNQSAPSDTFTLERVKAILHTMEGSRSRVIPEYEKLVANHPDDPKAQALLGTVLFRFNEWERARQLFEQAGTKGVRLDRELGIVYLRLGQRDQARQALLRHSEIDPEDADAHNQLCTLFFQEGDTTQAEQECQTAIKLDPQHDEAYVTLAHMLDRQGKGGESRLLLAAAMEIQGRLEAALSQYQQAEQALGVEHEQTAEIKKKTEELEEIIGQMPKRR
jgi:beta-barrel assembly-enhancing protease